MSGYLWHGKPDLERLNAEIMAAREGRVVRGRYGLPPGCGSVPGYWRHVRVGEVPCFACAAARRGARPSEAGRDRLAGLATAVEVAVWEGRRKR